MQSYLKPLARAGAKPAHISHLMRLWLSGMEVLPGCSLERLPLPADVHALIPSWSAELDGILQVASAHAAEDGGARLLLRLADESTVECVLLPRDGLCISTQVGCAVGCSFCMTGRGGLQRQLGAHELLAQVVAGRRRRRVRRVVLMGMGEPAHNLDAVLEALTWLGNEGGFGHKDLVFSTVGDLSAFERLAAHDVKPALGLSLHSTYADRRRELLPRAPRVEPRELCEAALAYADRTGHPLQLQWTLLAGVNDGDDERERLASWISGRRVVVNYIVFNELEGSGFRATSGDRTHELTRSLHARKIIAKLRRSAAFDVDGACGQLRARQRDST